MDPTFHHEAFSRWEQASKSIIPGDAAEDAIEVLLPGIHVDYLPLQLNKIQHPYLRDDLDNKDFVRNASSQSISKYNSNSIVCTIWNR
jgi:hypothetical protein